MFSDLSPRELREFRDHLMRIGQGLTRESGDEEALVTATGSLLTLLEYINGLIDNQKFEGEESEEENEE